MNRPIEAYQLLAERLQSDRVVAFIGAGVSAEYTDKRAGFKYKGLPTARQLVRELAINRTYIDPSMPFDEACFVLKTKGGKGQLINFLKSHLGDMGQKPLPAHEILATLPFSAYVSMNFDTLLEDALVARGKHVHTIITDDDVAQLAAGEIPVIKPHGCLSRPTSLIAASDEMEPFLQRVPIVDAFVKTIMANNTVLFVGFALRDADFRELYRGMKRALKGMMPLSYAVGKRVKQFDQLFWEKQELLIIESDLTRFLRGLLDSYNQEQPLKGGVCITRKRWWDHPFLADLHAITNQPSESQVIEAFISRIEKGLSFPSTDIAELAADAEEAGKYVMEGRPNYVAFDKAAKELVEGLKRPLRPAEAQVWLMDYRESRKKVSCRMKQKGRSVLKENQSVLLYSQSTRVHEVLRGVPRAVQRSCRLYVAECRPKSRSFFQDAASTIDRLKDTDYKFSVIPDMAIGNLILREEIHQVIMGAHAILVDEQGRLRSFVNTAGSLMISLACEKYHVPLFVVAESAKEDSVDVLRSDDVSYKQEEKLDLPLSLMSRSGLSEKGKLQLLNIGYDLVEVHEYIRYVNER